MATTGGGRCALCLLYALVTLSAGPLAAADPQTEELHRWVNLSRTLKSGSSAVDAPSEASRRWANLSTPAESSTLLSRPARQVLPCYSCSGGGGGGFGFGACVQGWQVCNGRRDCPGGQDEASCDDCLCEYTRVPGATLRPGRAGLTFWTGISLKGCGRVCSHFARGCVGFTYSGVEPRKCVLFTELRPQVPRPLTDLYLRGGGQGGGVQSQLSSRTLITPVGPVLIQHVGAARTIGATSAAGPVNCGDPGSYECDVGQCIAAARVCDGLADCGGGSEEAFCDGLLAAFAPLAGPVAASRRLAAADGVRSLPGCAAACLWHWSSGQACTAFIWDGRCELGCVGCGGGRFWLDGSRSYRVLAPRRAVPALYARLSAASEAGRRQLLRALFRVASAVPGNRALGDQAIRLEVNGVASSFDTRAEQRPTPALPPNLSQTYSNRLVGGGGPDVATTVVGYLYTTRQSFGPQLVTGASVTFQNPAAVRTVVNTLRPTTVVNQPPRTVVATTQFIQPSTVVLQPATQTLGFVRPPPPPTALPPPPPTAPPPSSPPPPTARPTPPPTTPRPSPLPTRPARSSDAATPACGRRPAADGPRRPQTTARVVGGRLAGYGAYPWQAQLLAFNSSSGRFEHLCGAVVVSARHLVTAAHCVGGGPRLRAVVGVSDLSQPDEPERQEFDVANAVSHPDYRSGPRDSFADDIAVLRLRGVAIRFSDFVQPLCLPRAGADVGGAGQSCLISGWGRREFDPGAGGSELRLRGASVPVVSDAFCASPEVHGARFRPGKMVCAGSLTGGTDSCQGDSGGPLACADAGGRWTAVGVVSFGFGCGVSLKPGVYTKVENYVDWLEGVMRFV